MKTFIDHARDFRTRIAERYEERERFARLAHGQAPQALFITCSDSRVIPSLITGAQPGELFELRTAGNAVPAYGDGQGRPASAEAATIEYAVCVLGVADIVVCGHSHCGAVGAKARGDDLAAVPAVREWLTEQLSDGLPADDGPDVAAAVQRHVRAQLARLRGYPCVAERIAAGQLGLHGWFYEVHTGLVLAHDPSVDAYLPL
ncbi:carbonic anhydrase (plasmid) [Streptomyces sp. NBC_01717]|uniref:carbonic anhydrase n=1 Tax=Streptomyces sp. NBC_01717 TaxID=2975918 RepID=UPI002E351D15|nr:carbonic anhydrase [Streptomyces sp. NBC_01717]